MSIIKSPTHIAPLHKEEGQSVFAQPGARNRRETGMASSMPPPGNVTGNFPAGVYQEEMNQMMPFSGNHHLPTGQSINVSMNAPSPHLSFKEWMQRGIVGGLGNAAAWPFRLVAKMVEEVFRVIINLFGKLILFVLLPTALILGYKMAMKITQADTVEQGAVEIMHHGRHAADGMAKGLTDDLPPEENNKK
jgi:hypothetical protein